ncbi:MAG: DNA-processing protein DprA [Syntrophaceae bacterium]|nr:DNA-processing protein DprA [Syntrophaceae bacterium]
MTDKNITQWIALKSIPGIGNVLFFTLLDKFGSIESVFGASANELSQTAGISKKIAAQIVNYKGWDKLQSYIDKLNSADIKIITFQDKLYPKYLHNVYDRPAFLYTRGHLEEDDINLAIVGSRAASTYGKYTTERISRELAQKGVTVVSGMARGIDSAAHRGALAARGRTIAVLGSGLDVIYPPENKKLFAEIIENGAVISEFPMGTPPIAANFPSRNRIISGMSYGVLVVEAGEKSGSLITARLALEQGREVFAVPGSVETPTSRGANRLIKEGAKLIENAEDILEEIIPQLEKAKVLSETLTSENEAELPAKEIKLTKIEKQVADFIFDKRIHIDDIIAGTNLSPADVLSTLMSLELKNLVTQHPGKYFSRTSVVN